MIEITSRKNKTVLDTLDLKDKKARDGQGLFFTEGRKLLEEASGAGMKPVRIFVTEQYLSRYPNTLPEDGEIFLVTPEVYDKLTDENAPEGVFAVFEKPSFTLSDKASSVLLLEGIRDPGNLGTLLRCAVAFGVRCVITVSCADVYSPKTVRATMGAVFKMPCVDFPDIDSAVKYARELTPFVIATALHEDSIPLDEADTAYATIMIGNEGNGLTDRAVGLADAKVIIPIENIESLNASTAGAVCMYDSMMKRRTK